jgi:Protein of unknown function (DUF2924)
MQRASSFSLGLRSNLQPIAGTRLIRGWQGVEHVVTVRDDGYEYRGAPYKSLSSIARAITDTRWNGWVFFGLKNARAGEAKVDAAFASSARFKPNGSRG